LNQYTIIAIKELIENKKDIEDSNLVNLLVKHGTDGKPVKGDLTCIGKTENCDKIFKLITEKAE